MKINGKTIAYSEHGQPGLPALVCLHGLAGNSRYSFEELAAHLKDDFHLYLFDSPAHGGTDALDNATDYRFSSLADWFDGVFTKTVPEPFYLLGHSWGADAALHYTAQHPEKVRGLILLDGAFTFPHNQPEMTYAAAMDGWRDYMDSAVYPDWDAVMNEYRTYTKRWNKDKEAYVKSLFKERDGAYIPVAPKSAVLAIIEAFFAEPFTDAYPKLRMPVLLLHAEEPAELSEARARGTGQMRESIRDVTIRQVDGAGHMLMWDAPEQTAREVTEWIRGICRKIRSWTPDAGFSSGEQDKVVKNKLISGKD
ncbi:alpha/beta fold hydrolase [Planococcus lenghuensis]|uniref:AB hydrolase-1 domain-containing protein n=1 Tax=Planococcus lenghuensis TaxID=2213202 RepID=A0A1Q2L2W3_9BACL|nr:alpha/beta hydrolase [Planococcus lenghuensis]AQQ54780.1 hypothetical protein B0X71_17840 [Planococcus lenghuensis]